MEIRVQASDVLEFHYGNYVCKLSCSVKCGSVLVSLPGLAVFISENNVFTGLFLLEGKLHLSF